MADTLHRIAVYNHKGGVGKTTLSVNIASALAHLGKRVLLVDSDPQCNLTSYLIEDAVVDDLLDHSEDEDGRTIWTALKPVYDGTGDAKEITPYETGIPNLFLMPGDLRLAQFELLLGDLWTECFKRSIRGLRGTNSLSTLIGKCAAAQSIDFVFYDTGPNIGPLNRVILLDCDFFIVPAACDLFSVRALKTLGHTIANWARDWQTIVSLAPDQVYLMEGKPKYLGYIPERFKTYGQTMSVIHARNLGEFEKHLYSDLVAPLRGVDAKLAQSKIAGTKLGEVPDFSTLVTKSQAQGVPLDVVKRGNPYHKEKARRVFASIAEEIIHKTSGS